MDKLRMRFEKTGRAVYISHLDLMRTLQRGFSRAGYELKHSEGFNPHPQISIALPLSVGMASRCELMDFRLDKDEELSAMPERLTAALPEGLKVTEVYKPERKCALLKWLECEGVFEYDRGDTAEKAAALQSFFSRDELVITKKTKRGLGETDIKPGILRLAFEAGEGIVTVHTVVSAQEPTINPELLCEALRQLAPELTPDFAKFTRLETYDADMKIFR